MSELVGVGGGLNDCLHDLLGGFLFWGCYSYFLGTGLVLGGLGLSGALFYLFERLGFIILLLRGIFCVLQLYLAFLPNFKTRIK